MINRNQSADPSPFLSLSHFTAVSVARKPSVLHPRNPTDQNNVRRPVTESKNAVFLSYAAEDSEAAQRLCATLRGAGVEVWFDQSELRGGDVWDQKIRREIRDCTLFIPIISAHTQARLEGYFRCEWKLAAARTDDMADDKPFLVPVVVDGTREQEARVPEQVLKAATLYRSTIIVNDRSAVIDHFSTHHCQYSDCSCQIVIGNSENVL
jgi:hypothetical protein